MKTDPSVTRENPLKKNVTNVTRRGFPASCSACAACLAFRPASFLNSGDRDAKEAPFRIMTHSEDRAGASVQSILPLNYMTTTLEMNNSRKEILMHQAVSLDNDSDDRACRTKLSAEPVGDIEKLFTMWGKWGWHRVTFYGDLREPVKALADASGWKVVEEA